MSHIVNVDWNDWTVFKNIPTYLKYGVPTFGIFLTEMWTYKALNIFTAWLGNTALACSFIIMALIDILSAFYDGLADSTIYYVGMALGQHKIQIAKTYFKALGLIALIISSSIVIFISQFRNYVISGFTTDDAVKALFLHVLPLVLLSIFLDTIQYSMWGVVKVLGLQTVASVYTLFKHIFVTLLLTYLIAFTFELGYMGIWMALPIGNLISIAFYIFLIFNALEKRLAIIPDVYIDDETGTDTELDGSL